MLRSMYTGISGMKGFQTKLDVVSNNIANVNTFGFKKGRYTFSDLMSQTMQGATGPIQNAAGDPTLGGRNPMQVGLGTTTGSIDNIHTQGNRQTTNRPLDLAIEGDGMFATAESVEGDDALATDTDDMSFTRAGNFYFDDNGHIVTSGGRYLVGRTPNADNDGVTNQIGLIQLPDNAQSFSIGGDGTVNYVDGSGQPAVAGQILLANFSNPEGLDKVGSNSYKISNNAGELDGGIAIIFSCQEKAGLATYLPVRLKCPMSTFQKNSRR